MTIDDVHPEVDLRSVLGRLRDDLEELVAEGAITLGSKWPAAQDFVDAMDDGDALLVPLRPAPLAADELRTLAGALGDDLAVVRVPPAPAPDTLGDAEWWSAPEGVGLTAMGGEQGIELHMGAEAFAVLDPDEATALAAALLSASAYERDRVAEAVDG